VVAEVLSSVPGPGKVVVSVRASAVDFPDSLIIRARYQFKPALPFSPGSELAGAIGEIDKGEDEFAAEDRVIALTPWGSHAEEECVDAIMGARVIAAASSEEKLALCRFVGADECINYTQEDLCERVKMLAGAGAGTWGVDVAYDPLGCDHTGAAVRSKAWNGRHLVIRLASGDIPKLPLNLVLLKECSVVGVFYGAFTERETNRHMVLARHLLDWLSERRIKPRVTPRHSRETQAWRCRWWRKRRATGKIFLLTQRAFVG
jgi:NADPH:quinone reductase